MKVKGKILVRVLTITLIVCMLALPVVTYSATPGTQQKSPGLQPDRPRPQMAANTITITSPQAGQTWYTGYGANITWNCNTPLADPSCMADVALWQGGKLVKQLGAAVGGGQKGWAIPPDTPGGSYEIRVNNVYTQYGQPQQKPTPLPGLEGRQTFTIMAYVGCTGTGYKQLTQDTNCKYNPSASAKFKGGTGAWPVLLDANSYVTSGQLASDQPVFFASGKVAQFLGYPAAGVSGVGVYFQNGYVFTGTLASDQRLDWAPGQSCLWKGSTGANFRDGYLTIGTLAQGCTVPGCGLQTPIVYACDQLVPTPFPAGAKILCVLSGVTAAGVKTGPYCQWTQ